MCLLYFYYNFFLLKIWENLNKKFWRFFQNFINFETNDKNLSSENLLENYPIKNFRDNSRWTQTQFKNKVFRNNRYELFMYLSETWAWLFSSRVDKKKIIKYHRDWLYLVSSSRSVAPGSPVLYDKKFSVFFFFLLYQIVLKYLCENM